MTNGARKTSKMITNKMVVNLIMFLQVDLRVVQAWIISAVQDENHKMSISVKKGKHTTCNWIPQWLFTSNILWKQNSKPQNCARKERRPFEVYTQIQPHQYLTWTTENEPQKMKWKNSFAFNCQSTTTHIMLRNLLSWSRFWENVNVRTNTTMRTIRC